jgi:hypothetical protein
MFAISLSSCSRYNANFKLDQSQCSLFMTVRHIFEISEDDHPRLVTHARDIWWTLDFANAFVSPGVNSRGELVPPHGASRRRLGDYLNLCDSRVGITWQRSHQNIYVSTAFISITKNYIFWKYACKTIVFTSFKVT